MTSISVKRSSRRTGRPCSERSRSACAGRGRGSDSSASIREYRREGVGARMMVDALAAVQAQGVRTIELEVNAAQSRAERTM